MPKKDASRRKHKPSHFREARANWLSTLFHQDSLCRVKCSDVLKVLRNKYKSISVRECGFIVRKCFPTVKRIHSNHVYFYSGISHIDAIENVNQCHTENDCSTENKMLCGLPDCMSINRSELLRSSSKKPTYSFPNGNFDSMELCWFRGMAVAVRKSEFDVIDEARTILSLPSHPCFPILIGICRDEKPFILITKFYGHVGTGVYMSLEGLCYTHGITFAEWISLLIKIWEGIELLHSCGFAHGGLGVQNIIVVKQKEKKKVWVPVFLNLNEVKALCGSIENN
ncbi:uncharacterized protein LOC124459253 [Xenia sp. Carnegie-2017]|uniref:uncharacterized protein LOC124459253 n=1 Tax=Xenia sp. Carnegie-2017 TaxID=2897299 RepID=UPI001F03CADD|nr:uncharacterized protein LOC124459253 [Xenia sp. Carnegie-2017]